MNIFRNSSVSSLVTSWFVINATAASCNFWSAWKFLKFSKTLLPTSLFIFELGAKFFIHGCSRASIADILLDGTFSSSLLNRSFASFDISWNILVEKSTYPFFTFCNISSSLLPLKGGSPVNSINIITPIDHKSHFSS